MRDLRPLKMCVERYAESTPVVELTLVKAIACVSVATMAKIENAGEVRRDGW
jgi:hypothetical protein